MMTTTRLCTVGGALALAAAGLWFGVEGRADQDGGVLPYDDPEAVALGQTVYADHCAACHGAALEGQPDWQERGPDGLLPAPPHDETGHTWHHDDWLLVRIVTEGTEAVVGGGYQSSMIGYGDILSDAEIRAVLGYIKSTWPAEVIEIHDGITARAAPFRQ